MDAHELIRGEPGFPAALLSPGTGRSGPDRLWVRGSLPESRMVAVVGARAAGRIGLEAATALASALARAGIAVVSGGALGIDAAAHRGALAAGGRTVVVLGTGVDVVYPPDHGALFAEVVARSGALVSQFPRGQGPSRGAFPTRNGIIAALGEATVVVEAGEGSGALITARAALRLGRWVIAFRGSPGCALLAAAGVETVGTPDEASALLLGGAAAPAASPVEGLAPAIADPRARRLWEALDRTPRDLGEAASLAGLPASEALALAIDLELGGHAARAAGGRYLRLP